MRYSAELQITHQCKWTGCTDWGCEICRQNVKRCFHDLHPSQTLRSTKANDSNAISSSQLQSDCKQPFSVAIADAPPSQAPIEHLPCTSEHSIPTHIQVSLLDSSDGQSLAELASRGEVLEDLISSRLLSLPTLLKAELPEPQVAGYQHNQLIVPFTVAPDYQTGPWVMSDPFHIYSEYSMADIKTQAGTRAKTVSLVLKGLCQDVAGQLHSLEGLKPFVSSPFTFFTRRREDKGTISKRSTKLKDLQGMAEATIKKLKNLREQVPEKSSINSQDLPDTPIKTAGELYDFMESLPNEVLEEISNKILGRSRAFLASMRENLRERMVTIENDTRPRLWQHPSSDLGLLFPAKEGILVGPEDFMPRAVKLSSGLPVELLPEHLSALACVAMKEYSDPHHGGTWSLIDAPVPAPEPPPSNLTGPAPVSLQPQYPSNAAPERSWSEDPIAWQSLSEALLRRMDPAKQMEPHPIARSPFVESEAWPISPWTANLSEKDLIAFQQRSSEPIVPSQYSTPALASARISLPGPDMLSAGHLDPGGSPPHAEWLASGSNAMRVYDDERGSSKRPKSGNQVKRFRDKEVVMSLEGDEQKELGQEVFGRRVVSAGFNRHKLLTVSRGKVTDTNPFLHLSKTPHPGQDRAPLQRVVEFPEGGSVEMAEPHSQDHRVPVLELTRTVSLPQAPSVDMLHQFDSDKLPVPELTRMQSDLPGPAPPPPRLFDSSLRPLPSQPSRLPSMTMQDLPSTLIPHIPSTLVSTALPGAGSSEMSDPLLWPSLKSLVSEIGDSGEQLDHSTSFLKIIAALEGPDNTKLSSLEKSKLSHHASSILEQWKAHYKQLASDGTRPSRVARDDALFKSGMCGPPPELSSEKASAVHEEGRLAVMQSCSNIPESPFGEDDSTPDPSYHVSQGEASRPFSTSVEPPSMPQVRLPSEETGSPKNSNRHVEQVKESSPDTSGGETPMVQGLFQQMSIDDR